MGDLPPGLVLPDYARPDLAWQDVVIVGTVSAVQDVVYETFSGHFDVITAIQTEVRTTAAGTPRELRPIWLDTDGNVVGLSTVGETYAASRTVDVNFALGLSSVISTGLHNTLAPLPLVLMQPGGSLLFQLDGAVAGDLFGFVTFTVIHIPTGPPVANEFPTEARRPTPVI